MLKINETDGRLSAWGKQADAVSIAWTRPPDKFPEANRTIDLRGARITAYFDDGTEETVTPYCTFTPDGGWIVDPSRTYVSIRAAYVAKSGKTLVASIGLAVVHPIGLRIVSDPDYIPREQYFNEDDPLFNPVTMPIDFRKFSAYILYASGDSTEPVYVEEATGVTWGADTHSSDGGGYGHVVGITGYSNRQEDIEVYYDVNEATTVTFDYACKVTAKVTIEGVDYTGETYIETIPIIMFECSNFPTFYDTSEPYEIKSVTKDEIYFVWADGVIARPTPGLSDMWIYYCGVEPVSTDVQTYYDFYLKNGETGSVWIARNSPGTEWSYPYEYTKYNYECEDGSVSWTREDEE